MTKTTLFIGFFSLLFLTLSVIWAKNRIAATNANSSDNNTKSTVHELNSEETKATLRSPTLVIIDFFAEWCGPCKSLKPIFEDVAQELKGQYVFAKVNIDKCKDIASEYQITSIPTILIFSNGQVVQRINGLVSKETLIEKINEVTKGPQDLSKLSKETLNEKMFQALQAGATREDVERIINAGADVNYTATNGLTPLMMTVVINASRGMDGSEMIKMLLAHGAKTEFTDITTGQIVQTVDFISMMSQNCKKMAENYDKMATLLAELKTEGPKR